MPVKKKKAREQTDRYFPQASDHPVGFAQTDIIILNDGKILCEAKSCVIQSRGQLTDAHSQFCCIKWKDL